MPTGFGGWLEGLDLLPVAREGADGGEEAGIITGVLREQLDKTSLEAAGHFTLHQAVCSGRI